MYEAYWGLSRAPFPNTLDPGNCFYSAMHHEALSRLLFLIEENRRCGTLTGPEGTGKSLLLRVAAAQLRRTQRRVVAVDLRGSDSHQMLWNLAAALRLGPDDSESPRRLWRMVADTLQGMRYSGLQRVLIFDHLDRAENDCAKTIERLLHIDDGPSSRTTVLIAARALDGQSSVGMLTNCSDLRIEVTTLDRDATAEYVRSSLTNAGCEGELFADDVLDVLYQQSRGVPRDINRLCDLSLLAAMGAGLSVISASIVQAVANELRMSATPGETLPLLFESA